MKNPVRTLKTIGVAGAQSRIGTTTQALQIMSYLQMMGNHVCYVEMDHHGHHFVRDMQNAYENVKITGNCTVYEQMEFYEMAAIKELIKKDYNFIVKDFGAADNPAFNQGSFLESDIRVFVCGAKPDELPKAYDIIANPLYDDARYIFSFVCKDDQEELKAMMENSAEQTFFAEYAPDPFTYSGMNNSAYAAITAWNHDNKK